MRKFITIFMLLFSTMMFAQTMSVFKTFFVNEAKVNNQDLQVLQGTRVVVVDHVNQDRTLAYSHIIIYNDWDEIFAYGKVTEMFTRRNLHQIVIETTDAETKVTEEVNMEFEFYEDGTFIIRYEISDEHTIFFKGVN